MQRTADRLWSEKLTWAYGSGELKAAEFKISFENN